jgi:hypothetical protein
VAQGVQRMKITTAFVGLVGGRGSTMEMSDVERRHETPRVI